MTKRELERRVERAITLLRRAMEVAERDHHRTDVPDGRSYAIWHDFGALEINAELALEELQGGEPKP